MSAQNEQEEITYASAISRRINMYLEKTTNLRHEVRAYTLLRNVRAKQDFLV